MWFVYFNEKKEQNECQYWLEAMCADNSCNGLSCVGGVKETSICREDNPKDNLTGKTFSKPLIYKDMLLSAVFYNASDVALLNSPIFLEELTNRTSTMAIDFSSRRSIRLFLQMFTSYQSWLKNGISKKWSWVSISPSGDCQAVPEPFCSSFTFANNF